MLASVLLLVIVTFVFTLLFSLLVERISRKMGIVAEDAHKINRVNIPKVGGLGFSLGVILSLLFSIQLSGLGGEYTRLASITLLIISVSALIGLVDDLKRLSGKTKVVLTTIPGFIVLLTDSYVPSIAIPFIGVVNASIVYPLLLPAIFAVAMNAVNMVDTHNGVAPLVTLVLTTTLLVGLELGAPLQGPFNVTDLTFVYLIILTALVTYLPFNIYPSRMFNGDTGSLTWGALLAFLSITTKLEALLVMAAMPVITNGFTILSSIKGFIEHAQLKERPVKVDKAKNLIIVNPSEKAPITLASMAVSMSPLREDELVCTITLLVLLTSLASLVLWHLMF